MKTGKSGKTGNENSIAKQETKMGLQIDSLKNFQQDTIWKYKAPSERDVTLSNVIQKLIKMLMFWSNREDKLSSRFEISAHQTRDQ